MPCESGGGEQAKLFALVAYIPDPLRYFLADLRRELAPGCTPRGHVTVLPPRPLSGSIEAAIETVRARLPDFSSLLIRAGPVEVFRKSHVVYLTVAEGRAELEQMH